MQRPPAEQVFDAIVVGSGYGGAVAALHMARKGLRVCVLERGQEYLPGMFPARLADAPRHLRITTPGAQVPQGFRDGLFDLRVGQGMQVLVANGLGGGSLINAGVMEDAQPQVLRGPRWPLAIQQEAEQIAQDTALRDLLGASPVQRLQPKDRVMQRLGARPVAITVAHTAAAPAARSAMQACIGCGDCFSGCNHEAKLSLDVTLLARAAEQGAQLVTGATVLAVQRDSAAEPDGAPWTVLVQHTDGALRDGQPQPFALRAAHVVLAAGTLGSPEILMRSQASGPGAPGLQLSGRLGQQFSGNGDIVAALQGTSLPCQAVADERVAPAERQIGPTISQMLDLRDPEANDVAQGLVVQDLAVPAVLRRVFEEATTTAALLRRVSRPDTQVHPHPPLAPSRMSGLVSAQATDTAAVDPDTVRHSLAIAVIGHDTADGQLRRDGLPSWPADGRPQPGWARGDGLLTVDWPGAATDPRLQQHHDRVQAVLHSTGSGGQVLPNPMWNPLPPELQQLLGNPPGSLTSVHPLGGCPMGDSLATGVVNHLGQVFDGARPGEVIEGLYVLDGSIIPSSLGINPALTIARLAQRAVSRWAWLAALPDQTAACRALPPRLPFMLPAQRLQAAPAAPTRVQLTEQMRGPVQLQGLPAGALPAGAETWLELTLTSQACDLATLFAARPAAGARRAFVVPAHQGRLRLLARAPRGLDDAVDAGDVLLDAPLAGELQLFDLEASRPAGRIWRAFWGWARNRGVRDISQSLRQWLSGQAPAPTTLPSGAPPLGWLASTWMRARVLFANLSHAGAVRRLDYRFTLGTPTRGTPALAALFEGQAIEGCKRLSYAYATSPVAQLMDMQLQRCPQLAAPATLSLKPRHLAALQVPLLRIVGQQDRVAALADLASFGLYCARLLIQTHLLSFRKPDAGLPAQVDRLARALPQVPGFAEHWLTTERSPRSSKAPRIRLARYGPGALGTAASPAGARPQEPLPPVLLIHGYSASSNSFAHPAVPGGLAQTLVADGRDVWLVDLRSSAGLDDTAREPWAMEDPALLDIPPAIDFILQHTGAAQVDVVAHCMGAAMFSMAWLQAPAPTPPGASTACTPPFHQRIARLVLSQIGPALQLTEANVLRAYVMRYMRQFLPLQDYQFQMAGAPTALDTLLDRLLAVLPVPHDEFVRENPLTFSGRTTPWVAMRHRMDALYARTFKLANLSDEVLARLGELFGPLNIETVSQVIHFAQQQAVTWRDGTNAGVFADRLAQHTRFAVMSIHGEHNGLAHPATLERMATLFRRAGAPVLGDLQPRHPAALAELLHQQAAQFPGYGHGASLFTACLAGMGHQDPLIGRDAGAVSTLVARFLRQGRAASAQEP